MMSGSGSEGLEVSVVSVSPGVPVTAMVTSCEPAGRIEQEIERREDSPFIRERQDPALRLVPPFVQSDFRSFEQRQLSQQSGFMRGADDSEVGLDLGRARLLSTRMGVAVLTSMLNRMRSRSGFRSSVRSSLRRAVIAASNPVSKLMSPVARPRRW